MSITNDKIKLESSLNVINISEIIIDLKTNNHGFLKVVARVDMDDMSAENMDSEEKVKLLNTETNEILFCGVISSIEINFRSGNKVVTLECETGSAIFDREKKTRTFQNEKLADIILKIGKAYKTQPYIELKDDTEQFSVQYKETDFEFMKRLASEKQMVLMPHIKDGLARLYLGVKNQSKTIEVTERDFIRVDQSETKTENPKNYHVFSRYDSLDLGDIIKYKDEELVVIEAHGIFRNSTLCYTYKACLRKFIKVKALKNELLVGASLKAEVIDVEYQSLKVRFHVDDEQDISKAKWINYSPVGSNAWYSLPHIANEVDVYFPNTDARTAIVISTSRDGHDGENTMKNPKDKVLATKWGAKLALTRSSIELSNSFTEIKLGDNIEISSNDSLTIESLNEINIGKTRRTTTDADGKKVSVVKETKSINIEAEEMVSFVVTGKSGAIEVDDEVVFTSAGETISEGLEKLALPSMEIDNEVWEAKSIAPVEEVEDKKGGFWNNVGKALLAAVAVAAVAVIAVVSPISSAVFAALGAVATRISTVSDSMDTNLMINGGLATTSIALGAGAIISKLSRINSVAPEGELEFPAAILDALSSKNRSFSESKWGRVLFEGVSIGDAFAKGSMRNYDVVPKVYEREELEVVPNKDKVVNRPSIICGGEASERAKWTKHYLDNPELYNIENDYELVGRGFTIGGTLLIDGEISVIYFDENKMGERAYIAYPPSWEKPFVYKTLGLNIEAIGSVKEAIRMGEKMISSSKVKPKITVSGSAFYAEVWKLKTYDEFDPKDLEGESSSIGGTLLLVTFNEAINNDKTVKMVTIGGSTPNYDISIGKSYTIMSDKLETDVYFEKKEINDYGISYPNAF